MAAWPQAAESIDMPGLHFYQHEAKGADQEITSAIDSHAQCQQRKSGDDDDGAAGVLAPAG